MSDRDLYKDMGVPRDAAPAAIRKAFRNLSKTAHPDGGGSDEKFAALKLAHDVLVDQKRRATYDRTGKFEDAPVDNTVAAIIEMVAGALDDAVNAAIGINRDPATVDLKAYILSSLDKGTELVTKELHNARQAKKMAQRLAKRWRKKGDGDSPNMLVAILEERVRMTDGVIEGSTERLRVLALAKEWMRDYEFEAEDVRVWPGVRSTGVFIDLS